jgi:hypothetical protein
LNSRIMPEFFKTITECYHAFYSFDESDCRG